MNLRKWTWAILFALSTFIVGCSDDDILPPSEIKSGYDNDQVTLSLGESAELTPEFDADDSSVYTWKLDGEVVSTTQDYTFEASNTGSFVLEFKVANEAGTETVEYAVRVYGPYSKGIFIVNEGWFGHEPGSVNFWDRESDELVKNAYKKENPNNELGVTTQYACVYNYKLFLVSKVAPHLVVVNAETLKEIGRADLPEGAGQARGFVAIDDTKGYLSTSDGIYPVDLTNFQLGDKIEGVGGEVGNMLVAKEKLFALQSSKVEILNTTDNTVEKTVALPNTAGGMVQDKDGIIWVGAKTNLVKINPSDLTEETIDLPEGISVNSSYGFAWNAGSLTYCKENNTLYFAHSGGWSVKSVDCYNITAGTAKQFVELSDGYTLYGAGVYVDPVANKIYMTATKGWSFDNNRFFVYALDGTQEKTIDYDHYWFPALMVAGE
ncbi:DUF5074 domain-containing protein [Puteibacter caeruleilacunae]|nr:DUF5074 domain-containing protein [Puteibacter caeruleilacunae]